MRTYEGASQLFALMAATTIADTLIKEGMSEPSLILKLGRFKSDPERVKKLKAQAEDRRRRRAEKLK